LARKRKPPEHANHERWLVSYADFITLLFAFFTTLYAISTVDRQKYGKMVMSMRASFESTIFKAGSDRFTLGMSAGVDPASDTQQASEATKLKKASQSPIRELKKSISSKGESTGKSLGSIRKEVEMRIGSPALGSKVQTRMEPRGLVITLGEGGFFDSGSDQLKPEGRELLDRIASGLVSSRNLIHVEGHTDNVPIRNSRFPTNWELSTARSTAVVAYLITRFGFAPDRLTAAGYGEYRPVTANETQEGKARNRRVDITVLNANSILNP
jgi:chemotaxis protein MotB